MRNWLYLHSRAFKQAFARLAGQPLGTLLSALVMGIALALPAGGYILLDNVAALARGVSGTPEISLFLDSGAGPAEAALIEDRLQSEPELASFRFVPREEALQQLENSGLKDVLDGIAVNPLPDAFIITLRREDPALFEALSARMRDWPGVELVQLDSAWVKRLSALLELGRTVVLVLAGVLGLTLVIVTFNTIRLQILTQKSEIEVSRLLGATDRFIRRPFYWFGSLQGILGGLIALAAVWGGIVVLTAPVAALAETYGVMIVLAGPGWVESLAVIAFAAFLGWMGAAISVRRHLAAV
ncbi:MAG: permease-like cell division protein FtsX [Azoarcus sp.]|jgi:cell division transport system permease protein|nr:permease-like cell division protein FtsX [Azoarcus sp.]